VTGAWPWIALAGLGAFHGLNPAMGWLFAVALGLQRRRRAAVLQSLVPIAAGHALSVSVVVLAVSALRILIDPRALQIACGVLLIGFGLYRLLARHRGRFGMQVGAGQLVAWSFLMATAHGAGLMLVPVLLGMPQGSAPSEHAHLSSHVMNVMQQGTAIALLAVGIHTLAMLCTAGAVGVSIYQWVGLAFLRRGWINLDLIWIIALLGAGAVLLTMALGATWSPPFGTGIGGRMWVPVVTISARPGTQ
jgi:hypothetical protein